MTLNNPILSSAKASIFTTQGHTLHLHAETLGADASSQVPVHAMPTLPSGKGGYKKAHSGAATVAGGPAQGGLCVVALFSALVGVVVLL